MEKLVSQLQISLQSTDDGIDSCGMLISAVHETEGGEGLNLLMVDDIFWQVQKLH